MRKKMFFSVILILLSVPLLSGHGKDQEGISRTSGPADPALTAWITSPDEKILFSQSEVHPVFSVTSGSNPTIVINPSERCQTIDGFGNCLTGGSAILLNRMSPGKREALLTELFGTDGENIGISCLRISIGASDLSDRVFSYDDVPEGQTDPDLKNFSINCEKTDLIPVLKQILAINPSIMIMGSPWSAPVWMKTNGKSIGGKLKPEFYDSYAQYFVRYIQAMKSEGITIHSITVQNEPLHGGNNPSMVMEASEQAQFVRDHLGPAFREAGISTKIIVYDHNADKPEYPMQILGDKEAAKYVDGSAFHLYGGTIDALSKVHEAFPSKNLYFTEQWVGGPGNLREDLNWHVENLIIGATRNWCRMVLEWNLAADPAYDPHTEGGCTRCLGTVTINGNEVVRNPAWYILAHAAKFIRPGSVRIGSNIPVDLPNAAFVTPDGKNVVIVVNKSEEKKTFSIRSVDRSATTTLGPGAVGTFIW